MFCALATAFASPPLELRASRFRRIVVEAGGKLTKRFRYKAQVVRLDDKCKDVLSPLPAGQHTVHYHAETAGGFVADVTYNLTVK